MSPNTSQPYEQVSSEPIHIGEVLDNLEAVLAASTEPASSDAVDLKDLMAEDQEATGALQAIAARRENGEELPDDLIVHDRMTVQALAAQRQLANRQKYLPKEE